MDAIIQQLALVSESKLVGNGDLMRVAAAIQKQASRDLAPTWNISATVDAFEKLEDVPLGYWPMIVKDNIGVAALGIHKDDDRQPFALISSSPELDRWSLTASHEALEMLVDPYGDRLVAGVSPMKGQGRVSFLVEVCDPSEAPAFAYTCNGIRVSDFYTPRYFDPVPAPKVRYSFTDKIESPRQVLRGGYLSWVDSVTSEWWQEIWFEGPKPTFRNLGKLDSKSGSLRSQIDRLTEGQSMKVLSAGQASLTSAGLTAAMITSQSTKSRESTTSKARMWRTQIESLVGTAQQKGAITKNPQRRRRVGD